MYKLLLILLLSLSCNSFSQVHAPIDWNTSELKWYGYEEGMKKILSTRKPGILIIYADWCPACQKYSALFSKKQVVESLKGLILIRENLEASPAISEKYNIDGEYVPRTFALDSKGEIISKLYSDEAKYTYFLPSGDVEFLIKFSKQVNKLGNL